MDSAVLNSELAKARKRLVEQTSVVSATQEIIASTLSLPSLKAIASRRLPKLLQVHSETMQVISELEKALKLGVQPDLLDNKPSKKA